MKKLLIVLGGLVLFSSIAVAAAPDGSGGPWADFVVDYNVGLRDDGSPVDPARTNPTAALGVAENNDTINFVALGYGGDLTLGFYNGISNGPGADFAVTETTFGGPPCASYPERAKLEVSEDGVAWYGTGVPIGDCQDLLFDIGTVLDEQEKVIELSCINYVRITDTTVFAQFPPQNHITDAYDVDGVMALHGAGSCVPGDIDINKTASDYEVAPGEDVTYAYVVTNTGIVDLGNVSVTDDRCTPVTGPTGDDGDGILNPGEDWEYSCTTSHQETTENIGTVTAYNLNQDQVTDSDTEKVTVSAPGCTLTQGYWKNHYSGKHADETWGKVDDNDVAEDWLIILQTPPAGGDAWYILAHQYIAAVLNGLAGADDSEVEEALSDALGLLDGADADLVVRLSDHELLGKKSQERKDALELAGILGGYNEGLIGPGHCSENVEE